ncbi:MAG: DUF4870 domain-containing protein [Chloroflexi bacterium]|nr:DUF4870 domain-containing protein [Chloroflexota bacterium]
MPAKKKAVSPVEPAEAIVPQAEPAVPLAPVEPVPQTPPIPPQQLGPGDERTWGLLAHLSVLLNLITGFAGPIAALVIYLIYKERSRFVAYHALQSAIFQMIWWFGGGVLIGIMWAIVGALSAILIGVVLIPVALILTFVLALLPLGALIYGIVGAVQVSQGQDFKYWLVGDWMRGTLTGA